MRPYTGPVCPALVAYRESDHARERRRRIGTRALEKGGGSPYIIVNSILVPWKSIVCEGSARCSYSTAAAAAVVLGEVYDSM